MASLLLSEADDDSSSLLRLEGEEGDGALTETEPHLAQWSALYEEGAVLRALHESGEVYVDAHVLSTPLIAGARRRTNTAPPGQHE